jgi:two-component system OmpR family response regulator
MGRILIVDPEAQRRQRIAFILRHMGYVVEEQPSGAAEAPAVEQEPDLVLVAEQALPITPYMEESQLGGAFAHPTVVLGTEAEEVAGVPYLEMGADAYMAAPLDLRELLARVRAFMNRLKRRGGIPDD